MHLQAKSKRQEKLCCVRGCLHGVRKILVPGSESVLRGAVFIIDKLHSVSIEDHRSWAF